MKLDKSLTWKSHCEQLLNDCSKVLGLVFRFSKYILPNNGLKQVAKALILSKLNYCCSVWGSARNQESLNHLQVTQNKYNRLYLKIKWSNHSVIFIPREHAILSRITLYVIIRG